MCTAIQYELLASESGCHRPDTDELDRTTGIFGCILWTKLMAVLLLAISCMGTIGVKGEKITWQRIWAVLTIGAVLFS